MNESALADMERFFMALADKTRLRLLNLMRDEEVCVCFFTEVLGESQPKISRHLAYLRGAGIVHARRDGKWMNYSIVPHYAMYIGPVGRPLSLGDSNSACVQEHRSCDGSPFRS